tara:strand:- start:495 stop:716 length:222 start_codon:yes stop_codon:yes gene_type:complete
VTKGRQQTGTVGEQIACEFLQERGYRIVERNHRSRLVEKDIIADFEEFLVFCEVKTRRGINGSHPSQSVTSKN